jgi:acyl-coenzyme A thioesterase PaaI-like protein
MKLLKLIFPVNLNVQYYKPVEKRIKLVILCKKIRVGVKIVVLN